VKAVHARPPTRRRESRPEEDPTTEEEAMREEVKREAETAEPADEAPTAAAWNGAGADIAEAEPETSDDMAKRDAEAATQPVRASVVETEDDPDATGSNADGPPEPDTPTPRPVAGTFAIPARMRPEDAEEMLARLKGADPADPLAVDASAVETLSTPAVLGLVAAARARAEEGGALAVERPSPAFIDAFSDLGLFHDLMKMEFRT